MQIGYVRDMKWKHPFYKRGGIIPYIMHKDEIYFCLSVDSKYRTLIDLGGTREDYDCCIVDTALRECREESLGIFGKWSEKDLMECFYVENDGVVIIFVEINGNMEQIKKEFRKLVASEKNPEAIDLKWIHISNIDKLLYNIYYKILPHINAIYTIFL